MVKVVVKEEKNKKKEKEMNRGKKSKNLTAAYSDTSFPDKMKERVAEPEKHVAQVYFILIMQGRWQCIDP